MSRAKVKQGGDRQVTSKTAQFESALAEIVEVPNPDPLEKNPFLTMAKFIFADDTGNRNNQGIEFEDFPQVANSALDMPVKINYDPRAGVQNHAGSIPIGHIKTIDIDAESRKLIATAMLYADEFPEEVEFIKTKYAEGNAPGISWELAYQDSIIKDGVEWLKGIITKAATFVRNPAYGSRTTLLALAESQEFLDFLAARVQPNIEEPPIVQDKGGSQVEEELQKLKAEAEQQAAEATSKIQELEGQIAERDTQIQELTDKINQMERSVLAEARTRRFEAAGLPLEADAEKLARRQEFWVSLSDEAFEEYLNDLVTAKQAGALTASASDKKAATTLPPIPKFAVAQDSAISLVDIKADLRKLARS